MPPGPFVLEPLLPCRCLRPTGARMGCEWQVGVRTRPSKSGVTRDPLTAVRSCTWGSPPPPPPRVAVTAGGPQGNPLDSLAQPVTSSHYGVFCSPWTQPQTPAYTTGHRLGQLGCKRCKTWQLQPYPRANLTSLTSCPVCRYPAPIGLQQPSRDLCTGHGRHHPQSCLDAGRPPPCTATGPPPIVSRRRQTTALFLNFPRHEDNGHANPGSPILPNRCLPTP